MPRKKKVDRAQEAAADELLLRALRQLADETLEEEIPERLLRPLREARPPQAGETENGATPPSPQPAQRGPARRSRSSRS